MTIACGLVIYMVSGYLYSIFHAKCPLFKKKEINIGRKRDCVCPVNRLLSADTVSSQAQERYEKGRDE